MWYHSSKKFVEQEGSQKNSDTYDDFPSHLVETNSKTESNVHKKFKKKLKKHFPYFLVVKKFGTSRFTEFTSMKYVKDMSPTLVGEGYDSLHTL